MAVKSKQDLVFLAGLFVFLLILFVWSRQGKEPAGRTFGGAALPSVSSSALTKLDSCPTAKCLTVYVAPWCKICRGSTPVIAALARYLKKQGVDTRIVVGDGSPDDVRAYAKQIGPDTLVDLDGKVPVAGGVPNFMVSSPAGDILYAVPGVPEMYQPPFTDDILKEFASYLNLP